MPDARTTKTQRTERNEALEAVSVDFGVTQKHFATYAKQCGKGSGWIADHVDSVVTQELAVRLWGAFASHLFTHTRLPQVRRRRDFTTLAGCARNASSGSWQSITLRGAYHPVSQGSSLAHRGGMDSFAGPLTLVWGANPRRSSVLHVPAVTHAASPATSHNRRREEWALGEEAKPYWRGVSLVRTQELHGAQVRYRYAAHLVVELPAWFPPDRYDHGDASAGFDTGPGKIAVVTVHDDAGSPAPGSSAVAPSRSRRRRTTRRSAGGLSALWNVPGATATPPRTSGAGHVRVTRSGRRAPVSLPPGSPATSPYAGSSLLSTGRSS